MITYVELWKVQAIKVQNYLEQTTVKENRSILFSNNTEGKQFNSTNKLKSIVKSLI